MRAARSESPGLARSGHGFAVAGGGLAPLPVGTLALVGAVGSPVACGAVVTFALAPSEPWIARADVGFDADPVLARLIADGLAGFLVRNLKSGATFGVVDETGDVLQLYGFDLLRPEHRAPEILSK